MGLLNKFVKNEAALENNISYVFYPLSLDCPWIIEPIAYLIVLHVLANKCISLQNKPSDLSIS